MAFRTEMLCVRFWTGFIGDTEELVMGSGCIYIYIDTIDIGEVVSLEDDVRLLRVSGGG